jgi:hypothetical protein
MIWIPAWLAKAYARIYSAKKTGTFDFSEAAKILGMKDERPLAKTVAKLRSFGYLITRRDPVDSRRKLFRLIDPESIVLAMAIQSRAKTDDVTGKLRAASGSLDYYLNGAYAAYQYHRYSAPGRIDVSVRAAQLSSWIALLSGRGVSLSIDGIPAEKPAENNIQLHSDFDEKFSEHVRVIDGINYLSPEMLVILGIAGANPSIEDVLALLVVQRRKLDWGGLLEVANAYNATRFLGCILNVLNFESRRPLYESNLIGKMFKQSNLEARLDFPASMSSQPTEKLYESVASKWNLRLHLTHALVTKILTDLMRQ